jgi:hypothetical protein
VAVFANGVESQQRATVPPSSSPDYPTGKAIALSCPAASCAKAARFNNPLRANSNFISGLKLIWPVQSRAQKESAFFSVAVASSLALS